MLIKNIRQVTPVQKEPIALSEPRYRICHDEIPRIVIYIDCSDMADLGLELSVNMPICPPFGDNTSRVGSNSNAITFFLIRCFFLSFPD